MASLTAFLRARAENVAAALLAAMFVSFIVQIALRYVVLRFYPDLNIGWTVELNLTLWLWGVFWTSAFCLKDVDHVKFEIVYQSSKPKARRVLAAVSALAIIAGIGGALPATLDYITFYKIKRSATLGIRLDYVFSIYGIFAVAVIVRYAARIVAILRGRFDDGGDTGLVHLPGGEETRP